MTTGGLLAIDAATRFGYAFSMPGDPPCSMEHGSVQLPSKEGEGAVFAAYDAWLKGALARWQPRLVIYEAPFLDQHKTSIQTATRLIGLGVLTVKCCHEAQVYRVEKVENGTIKRFITGHGHAEKIQVIEAVKKYGFNPEDDNAADAIAIFLYAEARHAPHVTRSAGPLFVA